MPPTGWLAEQSDAVGSYPPADDRPHPDGSFQPVNGALSSPFISPLAHSGARWVRSRTVQGGGWFRDGGGSGQG